ncbi:MAG: YgaP family membrane protein [Devosia sp.]
MKTNVGDTDRIIRLIAGLLLVLAPFVSGLGLFGDPIWMWVSVVVGIVLIATASIRICPLYLPFGISTRKAARSK